MTNFIVFKLGTRDTIMFLVHHLVQPIFNILVIVLAYQMLANSVSIFHFSVSVFLIDDGFVIVMLGSSSI